MFNNVIKIKLKVMNFPAAVPKFDTLKLKLPKEV